MSSAIYRGPVSELVPQRELDLPRRTGAPDGAESGAVNGEEAGEAEIDSRESGAGQEPPSFMNGPIIDYQII